MKKTWNVNVNGVAYAIEYKNSGFGAKVTINGEVYKAKSQSWFLNLVDFPITIDGTKFHVVAIGNNVKLAVNGVYDGTGESYVPLNKVPGISNVFVAISCIGGWMLCGLIGLAIGLLFGQIYVKKGLNGKIGAVVGAFIGCTVIQLFIMIVVTVLRFFIGI